MENKINITTTDESTKEIIIREGSAAKIYEKQHVTLTGTIDAPRKFYEKRATEHKPLKSHVTYSREHMKIVMVLDEDDHFKTTITGKLELNPDFTEFGVNKQKYYTINELMQFLKMRKYFFADVDQNMKIVSNLSKFRASVQTQLEQEKDTRGNAKNNYERTVNTDLAMDFELFVPIFKGSPASKFRVEIGFEVNDASVRVWLESAELQELVLRYRDEIIDKELKTFDGIVVIEQ